MKTIIIGGVAAGASAAARLRRLDEEMEIVLLERGEFISYANCVLPYFLGGVVPQRSSLLAMTPERMRARYRIDVRTRREAVAIDRKAKTVEIRNLEDGSSSVESYDKLLIATGSSPVRIPIPGDDDPAVGRFWTIPDMDRFSGLIASGAKRALVVGAGFIGLEVAENLRRAGLAVTVVELAPQVLATLDAEMAAPLAEELAVSGIRLELGRKVVAFRRDGALFARLDDGRELETDLAVMSVGVKPDSELARDAGLELGLRGHIVVDAGMRTADPDIYAAGDVVEVAEPILGGRTAIPLAGPAARQGRIAADNIAGGGSTYPGSRGTAVVKVGKLTAGSVGMTERKLLQQKTVFRKIYLHPGSNVSSYPGGALMHIKLLFDESGKILGAQLVGAKGVDKRLDVIASAMQAELPVGRLAELELGYAPPYGSAKDPVNYAGMIASNVLSGLSHIVHADGIPSDAQLVDVREPAEVELGAIPGAVNLPLDELRGRAGELDSTRPVVAYCRVGMRGYVAERILRAKGFDVYNLSGGYLAWKLFHPAPLPAAENAGGEKPEPAAASAGGEKPARKLDVRGLQCPGPVVSLRKTMDLMKSGEQLQLTAPESFAPDLRGWCASSGNELLRSECAEGDLRAVIRKADRGTSGAAPAAGIPAAPAGGHSAAIVLFSNDLDKAMAAMIIACGMAASGAKVGIFFTFWGLSVLRRNPAPPVRKNLIARMFGRMLPKGASKLALSKMNMAGLGTGMMKHVMAAQNVATLPELLDQARQLGVRFIACEMAMNVMGITREELIDVDEVAGVASFVELAKSSNNTLFI